MSNAMEYPGLKISWGKHIPGDPGASGMSNAVKYSGDSGRSNAMEYSGLNIMTGDPGEDFGLKLPPNELHDAPNPVEAFPTC